MKNTENNKKNSVKEEENKLEEGSSSGSPVAEQSEVEDKKKVSDVDKLEYEKVLLLAEVENMKKRHLKEKSDLISYSNKKLISKIVSLLDNYEIALRTSEMIGDENVKKFLSGILMAIEDFKNCLRSEGVEEYLVDIGKESWDSRFCEVVDEIEDDKYEEGTVLEVLKKGYLLNGRMIRPASVVISKKSS